MEAPEETFAEVVAERLKSLQTNAYAIEKKAGLPLDAVRNVIRSSKKSGPSLSRAAEICAALDLELYIGPKRDAPELVTSIASEDFTAITVHTAEASAGSGLLNPEEDRIGTLAFKRTWLTQIGLNPAKASILRVKGDSMEPTINDGAIVLVDEQKTKPESNHIYAFIEDGELRVKRLEVIEGKVLTISSDNKVYQPEVRINSDMNKLRILGRVVWTGYSLRDE